MAPPLIAAAAAAVPRGRPQICSEQFDGVTQLVVKIDHMNQSKKYVSKLKKWAESGGLAGRPVAKTPF